MSRRLEWGIPETPPPKRPYRDSFILYGVLAVVIVLIAWATGGGIRRAVVWAVVFFVVATAWSVYHWSVRLRRAEKERRRREEVGP